LESNSNTGEMFGVIFRGDKICFNRASSGFISSQLQTSSNTHFDRVPYNFSFTFQCGQNSIRFNLISVHLAQGKTEGNRRKGEFLAISNYIESKIQIISPALSWSPYIILGDTNIEDLVELQGHLTVLPPNYVSLNALCVPTNVSNNKPFDHVFMDSRFQAVLKADTKITIIELKKEPGVDATLSSNEFSQTYSDHNPVYFVCRAFNM